MKSKVDKEIEKKETDEEIESKFPDYPLYPAKEDIYEQYQKVAFTDHEDISKKTEMLKKGNPNKKDLKGEKLGDDLDVPGSELDDEQENIGAEDEENNYYSLGGDDHNDLEEDRGE